MTTFVLTRSENAKSALKLGYPCVTEDSEIPRGSIVIRWGNGLSSDKPGWTQVLNKSAALQVSTDKLTALQSLARVVKTPELYIGGQTLPRGHQYVVRPGNHAEGSDFELVPGGRTCPVGYHATRFIEDTREYRVWFVRDKYLCAKRVPRSSEGQSSSDPCRSKWGYGEFTPIFAKLKEEVAKARLAIPLDFGAMDVLWKDGEGWYFLEINSAPSLDTPTVLKHFQTHIKAILGPQTTQEVVRGDQPQESAPNRLVERPRASVVTPSTPGSYEARYKAKLLAEKKAMEDRVYREVFGE